MSANSIEEVKSIFRDVYGTVALPQVRCRDCKWWSQNEETGDWGFCANPKTNAEYDDVDTSAHSDCIIGDGSLKMFGPNFGCVHSEQK